MSNRSGVLGIVVEHNAEATLRDGTVLRANVYRPDGDARYPGLLTRTPYDKDQEGLGLARYDPYVRAGYAVVVQDSRGRFDSDGESIPQYVARPTMRRTATNRWSGWPPRAIATAASAWLATPTTPGWVGCWPKCSPRT